MESQQSSSSSDSTRDGRRIRFANDSDLTFINYGDSRRGSFAYRQEARIHNAQRRQSRSANESALKLVSRQSSQVQLPLPSAFSLYDPVSTFARDPFGQDILTSSHHLESVWHAIFPRYFYLPHVECAFNNISDPSETFLSAAKASGHLYRSIVTQIVITDEAQKGTQAEEAVLRNQAIILRECRDLTERYSNPLLCLTSHQFQHLFAAAFSLSGTGFNKEMGYDSIAFTGTLLMGTPHNQAVMQTAITQWIWITMPRPGMSLYSTEATSRILTRKIDLLLDFVEVVQNTLDTKFVAHVSCHLHPSTALYGIVTVRSSSQALTEPFPGFYLVCRHHVLCLLHGYLNHFSQMTETGSNAIISTLETIAATCLKSTHPQCLALFLWNLISNPDTMKLNRSILDPSLIWAMKDLLIVHDISFDDQFASWLIHKSSPEQLSGTPRLDIDKIREKVKQAYPMK